MKYVEPLNSASYPERNGSYVNANPATGVKGSTVPAAAIEDTQREIVAAISAAGITPSENEKGQLAKAIPRIYIGSATDTEIAALLKPGDMYIR